MLRHGERAKGWALVGGRLHEGVLSETGLDPAWWTFSCRRMVSQRGRFAGGGIRM